MKTVFFDHKGQRLMSRWPFLLWLCALQQVTCTHTGRYECILISGGNTQEQNLVNWNEEKCIKHVWWASRINKMDLGENLNVFVYKKTPQSTLSCFDILPSSFSAAIVCNCSIEWMEICWGRQCFCDGIEMWTGLSEGAAMAQEVELIVHY